MTLTESPNTDLHTRQATPDAIAGGAGIPRDAVMDRLVTAVAAALEIHISEQSRISRSIRDLHAVLTAPPRPEISSGGLTPWQMRKVRDFIDDRISEPIRTSELAAAVRLSTRHFTRAFNDSFGRTPRDYIILCRVERAKEMMLESDTPLCQISLASGFTDQAHLSRLFRRCVGQSPGSWRRERLGR